MTLQNSQRCLLLLVGLLLSACAATPPLLPAPLVNGHLEKPTGFNAPIVDETTPAPQRETGVESTPKPPLAVSTNTLRKTAKPAQASASAPVEEASITVSFDQMPLPNFVQAIYSLILKRTYSMDPAVASRKDLVTLHAAQLQTPSQIETTARLLLKTYGVAVTDIGAGNYRIVPDNARTGYAPEILLGRALPEVPLPLRPIYRLVDLQALRSSEVATWLTKIFDKKVTIFDDFSHNSLLISGQVDDVAAVLAAIEVLDQPLMKGRQSQRINPVFWNAEDLGKKLNDILTTEGYAVTNAALGSASIPISLMPIQGINALLVFAANPAIMQHVIDWAKKLDAPNANPGTEGGYFTYRARQTNADDLAKTIQAVLGEMQAIKASGVAPGVAATGAAAAPNRSSRVVVNAATNTLIFQGDTKNQAQLFNLLQELDKPAKSALIEVTVAEVTLDDTTKLGVEWALAGGAGASYVGGTRGGVALGNGTLATTGLGIGTGGLTIARLNSAGSLRALLNLLATSTKANVLSSPRILARSGETATIQVGSEIPTITQQQTSAATAGSTGVLQSVQYRSTGVILRVKPIIYAGDRIDLDVSQEVSGSNSVGVADSPIINTRKVETHLSLKDGSPVLLGGLISQNNSRSDTGVPLLKDVPGLGQLFRTNTDNNSKTELLVLITPYIIADDHDAQAITNAFRNQLGGWAQPQPQPLQQPQQPPPVPGQ